MIITSSALLRSLPLMAAIWISGSEDPLQASSAQPHLYALLGDDQKGTTYYVIMNEQTSAKDSKDKEEDKRVVLISTVDSTKGCQNFIAKAKISDKTCFLDFVRTVPKEGAAGSTLGKALPNKDPIVKKLNELCIKDQLHYVDVNSGDGKAAPDTLYYGFTDDGIEMKVFTNEEGATQTYDVKGGNFGRFSRTMYGKAMQVVLENDNQLRRLILEPVNVRNFDGTTTTFSQARMSVLDGKTITKSELSDLLESENKPSRISRIKKSLERFVPSRRSLDHEKYSSKARLVEKHENSS